MLQTSELSEVQETRDALRRVLHAVTSLGLLQPRIGRARMRVIPAVMPKLVHTTGGRLEIAHDGGGGVAVVICFLSLVREGVGEFPLSARVRVIPKAGL